MPSSLLTTKLYFPPARPHLVSRPRLVDQLQDGLRYPLTLVSAPAGSGKTTLLSEWRAGPGFGIPATWLSLDNEDNDLSRFLMYLASALGALKAGIGESALAILQSPQPPPTQVILTALINDLISSMTTPFALVLDDYHVINAQPVHDALIFLLDHMPQQMHLVLLTRVDPPLPLSRMRVRDQLTEIRAADLGFTVDEASAFLNQVMDLDLTNDQVTALEERSEGWIAGLQLAALSMRGQDDIQGFISAFAGSHHYIVDYLTDEVLTVQSECIREFLLRTSILDRLTAPLCDALSNQTNSQEMLENLEHANLFLIPLDVEQRWYRYHHLFLDVLRNRLQQRYPDIIPELHHRAAEWYEINQLTSEALRHALAAGELENAARLVEQNAWSMVEHGELVPLAGWLAAVQRLMPVRPWLCIYCAWERVLTGQLDAAQSRLQNAEQIINSKPGINQDEARELQGHIAIIHAYITVVQREATQAVELARKALELLPEDNISLYAVATWILGASYLLNEDIPKGKDAMAESARVAKSTNILYITVSAMRTLAFLETTCGRLYEASEIFQEAIQLSTGINGKPFPVSAELFVGMGNLEYEWNHPDLAKRYLEESVYLSQILGEAGTSVVSMISLARLRQARGDQMGANELLHEAEKIGEHANLPPTYHAMLLASQMRACIAGGNISRALEIAADAGLKIERTDDWLRESAYLALARVYLAQGEADQALALLERRCQNAERTERWGHVIEASVIKALCLQRTSNHPGALRELEKALSLAEPRGYVRVFLDEGSPVLNLLRQTATGGGHTAYVRRLLLASDITETRTQSPQLIFELLSNRELEILRLVADGKSNNQIAEDLIIATGTVKKHLNNIFGKLEVQSRTQCVARARELSLL